MWKLLAALGIGVGAFMLYKVKNPDCIHDMKESLDDITSSTMKNAKNMMK